MTDTSEGVSASRSGVSRTTRVAGGHKAWSIMQLEQTSVLVNGQRQDVPAEQSVTNLLDWLKLDADRVAVEVNKILVRKRDWKTTKVPGDAQIEIVEFVGGG